MEQRQDRKNGKKTEHPLYLSLLLLVFAVVAVTMATAAWFTIADRTKVRSMSMDVTSGPALRFDLDAHTDFEEYVKTLQFEQIASRLLEEKGFDMRKTPLEPVTTGDYEVFTLENGTVVSSESGAYLEFVLHFMAKQDMLVHLTSAHSSSGAKDGTAVTSSNGLLPQAMRISFTTDGFTWVYSPGMKAGADTGQSYKIFGLPSAENMVYKDDNALFWLEAEVDKPVTVRIWLEGSDPACTDELRGADYAIALRFEGTDSEHGKLSSERSTSGKR